jgi:hypothetical protein
MKMLKKEEFMKVSRWVFVTLLLVSMLIYPRLAFPVTLGQMDTFEDGTTQNWLVGLLGASHPAPPTNVPTGGPAGVDDNYLLLTALGGQGPGNRLTAVNVGGQWGGDYISAGVNAIAMDLRNFGSSDLSMRLSLADPITGPPTNLAFSTVPIFLPAGGGWTPFVFPINPSDLTAEIGNANAALTNATEIRIFHSELAQFPGPAITAQLGVDNIEATTTTPVPEPCTLLLVGSGLAGLVGYGRKKFIKK